MRKIKIGSNQYALPIPNEGVLFFSYAAPVVYLSKKDNQVFRTVKKFSVTTSKHINQFLEICAVLSGELPVFLPQTWFDGKAEKAQKPKTISFVKDVSPEWEPWDGDLGEVDRDSGAE